MEEQKNDAMFLTMIPRHDLQQFKGTPSWEDLLCQLLSLLDQFSFGQRPVVAGWLRNTWKVTVTLDRSQEGSVGLNTWAAWGISIGWHHYPTHPGWRSTKAMAGEDTKTLTY